MSSLSDYGTDWLQKYGTAFPNRCTKLGSPWVRVSGVRSGLIAERGAELEAPPSKIADILARLRRSGGT
jgi:hypothetical protein